MNTNKIFEEAANYLMGSCCTAIEALETVLEDEGAVKQLEEAFYEYLENNEIFECENCGWWGYSGEPVCDCQEECE